MAGAGIVHEEHPQETWTIVRNIVTAIVVVGVWIAFVLLIGNAVLLTLQATEALPAGLDGDYLRVALFFIGATVAILAAAQLEINHEPRTFWGALDNIFSLRRFRVQEQDLRAWASLLYYVAYLILGVLAVIAWLGKNYVDVGGTMMNLVPGVVEMFALVFLGSVLPVTIRYFTNNND